MLFSKAPRAASTRMKRYSKEGNATPFAPFLLPPEEDEEEDEDHIQMELQSDCYKNSDHDNINMSVEMAPAGEQDAPRGLQQTGNRDDVITKEPEKNGDELLVEAVQTTTTAGLFSTKSTTSKKADEGAPSSASSDNEHIKPAAKNILSNAVLPPPPPRLKSSGRRMLPPSSKNINRATTTKRNKEVTVAPAASQNKKQPIVASTETTAAADKNPPAELTKSTIKTTENDQEVKMVREEQGYRNPKGSTEILDENILPEQPSASSIEPDDALAVVPAPAQSTSTSSSSSSSSSSCAIIKEVNNTTKNNTELPSTTTRPAEEILESDDGEELVLKTRPGVVAADAGQQRPQVGNLLSAELTMQSSTTSDAVEEDDGEELVLKRRPGDRAGPSTAQEMKRVAARPENFSTDNTNAGSGSGSSTNLVQHPVAEDDKSIPQERVVVSNTANRADVVVQANNPATSNAAFSNVASASTQNSIPSTSRAPAVVQNELTVEAVGDPPAIIPREDHDVGAASLSSSSNAALAGTNQSNQTTLNQSTSRAPAVQEGPTAEALRDPAIIPRDAATASSSANLATGNESTQNLLQGNTSAASAEVQQEQITADELWDMLGEDKDKQRDEGPVPRPRDAVDTAPSSNPVAENESTDENQNTRAPAVQEGPTAEVLPDPSIIPRDAATASSSSSNLATGNESTSQNLQGNTSAPAVQQEQLTADALWDMLGQDVSRQKDEAGRQPRDAEAASSNPVAGTASTENQSTRAPAVVQDGLSAGALRDPAILPRVAATSSSSSSAAASGNQSSQINQSTSAPAVQEELTAAALRNPPIPGDAATASSSSSSNAAVVGNQSNQMNQSTTDPAVQQEQLTADALWDMLGGQDVNQQKEEARPLPQSDDAEATSSNPVAENESAQNQPSSASAVLRDDPPVPREDTVAASSSSNTAVVAGDASTDNQGTSAPAVAVQKEVTTADALWDLLGTKQDGDKQKGEQARRGHRQPELLVKQPNTTTKQAAVASSSASSSRQAAVAPPSSASASSSCVGMTVSSQSAGQVEPPGARSNVLLLLGGAVDAERNARATKRGASKLKDNKEKGPKKDEPEVQAPPIQDSSAGASKRGASKLKNNDKAVPKKKESPKRRGQSKEKQQLGPAPPAPESDAVSLLAMKRGASKTKEKQQNPPAEVVAAENNNSGIDKNPKRDLSPPKKKDSAEESRPAPAESRPQLQRLPAVLPPPALLPLRNEKSEDDRPRSQERERSKKREPMKRGRSKSKEKTAAADRLNGDAADRFEKENERVDEGKQGGGSEQRRGSVGIVERADLPKRRGPSRVRSPS
ncbi:unnamed protein product, partial [Amoebophrya sp. A120]|eukprot:GSA120T00024219001.1